ncbi:bifunctional PTS fructose transporter subunit IIA/HPr protein [Pasteurellaceae bacterium Orientalotternb1]|nr:bifunctional PTS fructose transporter subunit IIA/HPr protein [Pasteurellaceae bacterium Orientalotternb1]
MLHVSAQNVRLNALAGDKQQAIHLVAEGLVTNGNVAAGYEAGMLARETQTSTFLGNGIAIPHGTLDTRHLVQSTGVQVLQLPNGVEWGEGNTAYVVIGIAAKSDEHLNLLRQLTAILGDEQIAETLAKTQDLDQFIALLSGKSQLPTLSQDLISLNIQSDSLLTLSAINAAVLQENGYVNQTFVSDVIGNIPLSLGNNLYLIDSAKGNQANGIAVARNPQGKTLITVAATDDSLQPQLAKLTKIAFRQQLSIAPADKIVPLFQGKTAVQAVTKYDSILNVGSANGSEGASKSFKGFASNSEQHFANTAPEVTSELEAFFTIKNEHGLHARPSAVLVNEVTKYNATIQVQNLDRESPLVSAKSVMKIVALGVQKGHRLRFVATGEQAQQALDGIGAVIANGLGE